ncbi:MAG: PDZ domain-containing protein, partial [Candidatus Krumholzibacteriota bacterium]|nr:PDZ domain-containing protein [Candidatus Krumholzibacteriota bacterium]
PPADGKRVLDYTSDSNVPGVPISVAGVKLIATMDTGAPSGVSLPSEYISRLPLVSEPTVTGSGRTVDATFEIRSATLDGNLTVGQIVIENPTIVFNDMSRKSNIGMGLLRQFAITIDRANHRVAFDRSSQAAQPNSPVRRVVQAGGKKRYGIRLPGLSGETLEVTGVEKGLVAEQAGLMKGDRIIAMNGKPVASLSEDERMECLRGSPLVLRVERGPDTLEITLSLE